MGAIAEDTLALAGLLPPLVVHGGYEDAGLRYGQRLLALEAAEIHVVAQALLLLRRRLGPRDHAGRLESGRLDGLVDGLVVGVVVHGVGWDGDLVLRRQAVFVGVCERAHRARRGQVGVGRRGCMWTGSALLGARSCSSAPGQAACGVRRAGRRAALDLSWTFRDLSWADN